MIMKLSHIMIVCMILASCPYNNAKSKNKSTIENITDFKDFKKLLRTKTNVLVCFTRSLKESATVIKIFKEVAESIKGEGTMVLVDCSGEAKKMCKKLKVNPTPTLLRHYKDGDFNKDYDRKESVNSMLNFMRDPTGDIPWEEDSTAEDVLHVPDASNLARAIKKEQKPLMIMFYAPWCGFCKTLKPEYAAAATELKGHSVLAAIDVNRPENSVIRTHYNITGFPTMLYYLGGQMKHVYEGENKKAAIVSFMKNPKAPAPKTKDVSWNDTKSDVLHLSSDDFDATLKKHNSLLVMFHAPWCGHCKRMKPEYEKAASALKKEGVNGILAAVDATQEQALASRFSVKGYPTIKYFSEGDLRFDVDFRDANKIISFMKDPQEPPPPPPPETPWSEEKSEVVHLDENEYKPFLKKKKHALVMFYAPWCGHCKRVKPEFTKAADHFRDDPRKAFVAIDCTTRQPLCSLNDVSGYPTIKYFSYLNKAVRSYSGGRTAEDFIAFMSNPDSSGTPPPSSSSKAPGKSEQPVSTGSVTLTLDNNNFKQSIASKEPTLVFFFATWCGICTKFKPVYEEVAKELAGKVPVRFALFDCTDGGEAIDEYDISHFPTLKLFREGKFESEFDGKRTRDALKAFAMKWAKQKDEL
ncbi:protein disulfide-isomerase A5 [Coccinella septempunctata]|uniref:protein disulfide-isomerase A5 n=1 Tax=Coccinella septempunctata TaxID=41139 RepID=UPI001D07B2EC|nr:protein disulfide-isomerase A5 [Coccinella septempunctata]